MTDTTHDPFELQRDALEAQFQRYIDQLAQATVHARRLGWADDRYAAVLTALRQSVADTAQALRRMADGTYGICEGCHAAIPVVRLAETPHARFCVSCAHARTA